ncbi:TonB-dependent receptor [Parvularcula maris]|uniref:TonB-dependent receptor n=1 Tax=Parvularcula maris TaxID=2965077 RepID=A0A9X2L9R2_9PROT|nr:TonB-dependent receptor [Parvularcula maris]MCQ8184732.1 TonB-dependent receptor [Parvularcula maris]
MGYLLSGVAAAALLLPVQASAQPAEMDDVITVTAQKREQTLAEVPLSVDVISDDELDNITANGADILFLASRTPSLYAEGSFGRVFPRFYIRGLGNSDFDLNANQPVSVVRDEVVLENPILKGQPIFDLDRIEVLRGPQGTLFGRNTPAGIVKFETAKPTFEPEGYARLSYGSFDTYDAEAAVSGPLTDKLAGRLSFLAQGRNDFVDNTFEDGPIDGFENFTSYAARAQLLYNHSDDMRFLLNVHGYELDGGSRTFRANAIAPGGGFADGFDRREAAQDGIQFLRTEQYGGSFRSEWDVGPGTLTSITAYESVTVDARGDVDGGFGADFAPPSGPGSIPGPAGDPDNISIPFPAESQDNISDHYQFTSETRYAFPATDSIDLILGTFFFREELEIESFSFDTLAGNVINGFAIQDQETDAYAAFGSAEWRATDRVTINAGLRVSREERDFEASRIVGPFGAPPLGPIEADLEDTQVTGDFSMRYQLTDGLSVYGRYARGFRAPNAQGRVVFGDFVTVADTETIDSVELGTKYDLPEGLGFVSATLFGFNTNDQQLTAVGGAGNFNQLLNADGVVGWGVEIDGAIEPVENLSITFGYSFNDTRIDDELLEVGICGSPCTPTDPINPLTGNAQIDGNPLPNAPEHIANAAARYEVPVSTGMVYGFVDWAYRSEINFFLYESEEFRSGDKSEVGARLGYVHGEGGFEVSAFGRNIFNERVFDGAVDFNNFTGFVNDPATWGVEALVRF